MLHLYIYIYICIRCIKGTLLLTLKREAIYNFRTRGLHKLGNDPPIKHGERFNDGKVDPRGCYWAGTLARDESSEITSGAATLYCRDLDGSVKAVLTDLSISNGLVWTTDARSMYFIDTPSAQIDRLDFDPSSGTLSNRRPVVKGFDFETTGFPDGNLGWQSQQDGASISIPQVTVQLNLGSGRGQCRHKSVVCHGVLVSQSSFVRMPQLLRAAQVCH